MTCQNFMLGRMRRFLLCLALLPFISACGSSSDDGTTPATGNDGLLPPPERGLQLNMVTEIEAGSEVEHCQFFQVPEGEDLWIRRTPVRYDEGSHHVLVFRTDYDELPSETLEGAPIDASQVFDCTQGLRSMFETGDVVAGSQNADGSTLVSFPEGVAMKVEAGTWLVMNAHYINTTPNTLTPRMTVNLETIAEDEVVEEGGLLFFYNVFIEVPGSSESSARTRCNITDDIKLLGAQSHMHARGVGYVAEHRVEGAETSMDTFYETEFWEDVPGQSYGDGLELRAGDTLEYECRYRNAESRDVYQGPKTTDEMCMFIGPYYPRVPSLDNCSTASGLPHIGMDWVGHGDATCAESFSCATSAILQASGSGDVQSLLRAVTPCIVNADPAVSREVSAAIRCFLENRGDQAACSEPIAACTAG